MENEGFSDIDLILVVVLVAAVVLGTVTAVIAARRGRDPARWWLYGFLLWPVALPHALLLRPRPTVPPGGTFAPWPGPDGGRA